MALTLCALVQGADGNFYGTTTEGGTNGDGAVFSLTTNGTLTTLFSFEGTNGSFPSATLIQGGDGNFYGTTTYGGVGYDGLYSSGNGTVFRLVVKGASSFSDLTASQSAAYGTTAVTLAGKVSATGPIYPTNGETITVTINGNAQTTTINDSTGDFSFSYDPHTLPASETSYTIACVYAGDAFLNPATNTSTALTV